jgi:hypothetical protein
VGELAGLRGTGEGDRGFDPGGIESERGAEGHFDLGSVVEEDVAGAADLDGNESGCVGEGGDVAAGEDDAGEAEMELGVVVPAGGESDGVDAAFDVAAGGDGHVLTEADWEDGLGVEGVAGTGAGGPDGAGNGELERGTGGEGEGGVRSEGMSGGGGGPWQKVVELAARRVRRRERRCRMVYLVPAWRPAAWSTAIVDSNQGVGLQRKTCEGAGSFFFGARFLW